LKLRISKLILTLSIKIIQALWSLRRMEKPALENVQDTSTSSTSTSPI
jgi:hypothetical protein